MSGRDLAAWLRDIEAMHPANIALGLDRVGGVAQRLAAGKPAGCVITVGGTNGKGSTVAFLEAITRAAGLKVGAYTSPHFLVFNERIRVDGQPVDDATLVAAFERVEAARGDTPLTYFEFTTLAALDVFARSGLDVAVLEVGLGGRLDAVNLVDADVAVVTTVDIDHTDWLGDDRESIGAEKIGIARAGKPVILGDDDPPSSVLRKAYALGASAIRINCDFFFGRDSVDQWHWRALGDAMSLPMPSLAAPVQLRNAAMAIAALKASPLDIPPAAWALGVASASLPGRLHTLHWRGREVTLDVAHNAQAAEALADALAASPINGRTWAVLAMLGDKDASAVYAALKSHVDGWLLAGLDGPRGQSGDALAALIGDDVRDAPRFTRVEQALDAVHACAGAHDRILVLGSFHTVAEAFTHIAHTENAAG